jgi:hypothetical protein
MGFAAEVKDIDSQNHSVTACGACAQEAGSPFQFRDVGRETRY